ncbi:MAG TPA: transglycosylase SLT domain-containing protein [Longimicrobiales bacterium]|nr:transglycosylase SLT domain-containing protein [Longimicrobiales bacterium]
MRAATLVGIAFLCMAAPGVAPGVAAGTGPGAKGGKGTPAPNEPAAVLARDRVAADLAALREYRPGYSFWRHVFAVPDGQVLFGSGSDGRILASFPTRSDWTAGGRFEDQAVAGVLAGQRLQGTLAARRDKVAELLEPTVGPVVSNPTRGNFVLPNVRLYGSFLEDWAAIYERFGAPAEIGLAQAMVESGFNGKARSRANAHGLCQFLKGNWDRLNRLTPQVIEVQNQTTQAAYCAAYLTVLSTKYGSFIPALSEHHAGGANVGKVLINGARLGATDVRRRYFEGSDFARDLRAISTRQFRDLVGTYGIRSSLYAEMVFANAPAVDSMRGAVPQERIYAMRTTRAVPLQEIMRQTGLSEREVKRFNPALVRQVPRGATLYLPEPVERFGADVSFWLRPASSEFAVVLEEFVALSAPPEEWETPAFQSLLTDFRRRFRDTGTEEGTVMDAVIAYVMQELPSTHRVLDQFRTSPKVLQAFDAGVRARQPRSAEAESQH